MGRFQRKHVLVYDIWYHKQDLGYEPTRLWAYQERRHGENSQQHFCATTRIAPQRKGDLPNQHAGMFTNGSGRSWTSLGGRCFDWWCPWFNHMSGFGPCFFFETPSESGYMGAFVWPFLDAPLSTLLVWMSRFIENQDLCTHFMTWSWSSGQLVW